MQAVSLWKRVQSADRSASHDGSMGALWLRRRRCRSGCPKRPEIGWESGRHPEHRKERPSPPKSGIRLLVRVWNRPAEFLLNRKVLHIFPSLADCAPDRGKPNLMTRMCVQNHGCCYSHKCDNFGFIFREFDKLDRMRSNIRNVRAKEISGMCIALHSRMIPRISLVQQTEGLAQR